MLRTSPRQAQGASTRLYGRVVIACAEVSQGYLSEHAGGEDGVTLGEAPCPSSRIIQCHGSLVGSDGMGELEVGRQAGRAIVAVGAIGVTGAIGTIGAMCESFDAEEPYEQ